MITRGAIVYTVLALAVAIGVGYYFFYGREYVFRFTESELREALSARLPIEKSYLIIFQVTLDNPRIALIEGSDRVNAGLDVTLNIRLSTVPLPLGGSIDASGGIRYDASNGEFFLTDPVVEQLNVQGIPEQYASRAAGALRDALHEFYATRPIYTLSNLDASQAAARLVLKTVVVEQQELVITLGIGT